MFREDLKINPNNPRSLFGLAETQRRQKKSWTATMTAFKTNWRGGTLRVKDL